MGHTNTIQCEEFLRTLERELYYGSIKIYITVHHIYLDIVFVFSISNLNLITYVHTYRYCQINVEIETKKKKRWVAFWLKVHFIFFYFLVSYSWNTCKTWDIELWNQAVFIIFYQIFAQIIILMKRKKTCSTTTKGVYDVVRFITLNRKKRLITKWTDIPEHKV